MDGRPIGIFDSGVGGLTIWRAIRKKLPHEDLIFFADQGHVPYGEKTREELRALCEAIVRFLEGQQAKMIVVACNTATVYAIDHLRTVFPHLPFVGVVPVVKTLARRTKVGRIGVLSTPATAESPYLAGLVEQFASGVKVISVGCEGLEDLVETGEIRSERVISTVRSCLEPIQKAQVDVVGLGCTHFPFLRHRIKRMVGPQVRVFDSSRPVARRAQWLLEHNGLPSPPKQPEYRFYTTADADDFRRVASKLLRFPVRSVERVELAVGG